MDFAQQFKQAVARGDLAGLRRLSGESPELKSRIDDPLFGFDAPAIVSAAAQGKREVIETLLELGADINARSTSGPAVSACWITIITIWSPG